LPKRDALTLDDCGGSLACRGAGDDPSGSADQVARRSVAIARKDNVTTEPDSITDNDLMEQVKRGDLDKLGLLYEKYHKILFAYFFRLVSHAPTSEDLVQNVFFRLLKYRERFRADGVFSAWLFAVAHNVKNDHLRKSLSAPSFGDLEEVEAASDDNPAQAAETSERAVLLEKAMAELSPVQREVLVLNRYQGMKYKDIARILKCSENTIKARMFRAVAKLREIYGDREN
jgi:RNA polymerase sigma factor (sigma-70 family)